MINKKCALTACLILFLSFGDNCIAQSYGPFDVIEPRHKNELWLNPGLLTYHFDQVTDFNSINYGFGGEYKFSSVASLTAGTFRNSNYHQSNYLGIYWQPLAIGPVNIGLVTGFFNGYQNNNNGGFFPAILPAFTIEGKWVGVNLIVIPTIGDRVSGALSLQFKFKVFD
jgi:hypothetical protein